MRYGFYLPTRGGCAVPEAIEAILAKGEALGFSSTMVADHLVFPTQIASKYPYTVSGEFPGGGDALDQLSLLAFAAGRTRSLRLVTSVMILPYRNPVLTAKMLATIDVLSRGRVTVGAGVGWLREEFEALGSPDFDRRGSVSDEWIRIFRKLWTESPASFEGQFYRFGPLKCLPQPVQKPGPPIWIGGHSKAAIRRAARLGDGWHPVGGIAAIPLRPPEMRASLDELYRLTEKEGRDPSKLTISFKTPIYDTEVQDPEGRRPFSGGPEQVLEDVDTYAKLGVSELIFDCRTERLDESLERLERFAALVKPGRS